MGGQGRRDKIKEEGSQGTEKPSRPGLQEYSMQKPRLNKTGEKAPCQG